MILRTASLQRRPPDLFDVTWKSGGAAGRVFAPTPALLWPLIERRRAGPLSQADIATYHRAYVALLAERYRKDPAPFLTLLRREKATLGCYCHAPADASGCHRVVLAWVLLQIAHSVGIGVRYEGEWGTGPRLAVVGSRKHPQAGAWARAVVDSVTTSALIVSGGAAGVDRQAELAATARGLQVVSLPASATMWRRMGNAAGMVRNRWIETASDAAVALPWGEASGTRGMIEICRRAGKPVLVIESEEDLARVGPWQAGLHKAQTQERWTF